MLQSVFTMTLRERALGVLIGVFGVCAVLALGVGVYRGLEAQLAQLVASMPPALLAMMGMSEGADPSSFVLAEIVNLIAPLVFCGLAISMGAAAIAGEERMNTLAMLLSNPQSRIAVLLHKAGSLGLLVVAGCGLLWAGGSLSLALLDAQPNVHLGAAMVHLAALSLFFGTLALCIGAWTGDQTLATALCVGLLVVSWLATGVLPLFEGLQELARAFPWYYFSGARPLHHGVEWSHVALLLGLGAGLLIGSALGLRRRDLKFGDGAGLLERLKRNPLTAKLSERLSGGGLVSSVTLRTVSELQSVALLVAFYAGLLAIVVGPMFNSLSEVLKSLGESFPAALMAMIGFADLSTPEGWYLAEVFSLVAPGAVIVVVAMAGTRALAGEEAARTMDLLLSNPISRTRVVLEKAAAIVILAAVVSLGVFAGTAGGNLVGSLGMSYANIAAASVQTFALGTLFGMVALAAGAASGTKPAAVATVVGVALTSWALNAFLPVNPKWASWAKASPFHYLMENEPLVNGLAMENVSVLLAAAALLCALSVWLFRRRDLRG